MEVKLIGDDILIAIDSVEPDKALTAREREHKAEINLLQSLLGENVQLSHNDAGKPFIGNYNISISHSINHEGGFVAIILSKLHNVGIDVEYRSDRIMKIASRFLRIDERPQSVEDNLVCWCAKEAAYKLYSSEDLTYQEMRVNESLTNVENLRCNLIIPIHKIITEQFILVWVKE